MSPLPELAKQILLMLAGLVLGAIGLLVGLIEVIAIVDPVGTKMSDDADPFGNPHIPIQQHIVFVCITLLLLTSTAWLFHQSDKDLTST